MKNAHLSDRHKEIESFIQQVNAKTSSRTNESCVNIGGRESVLATNHGSHLRNWVGRYSGSGQHHASPGMSRNGIVLLIGHLTVVCFSATFLGIRSNQVLGRSIVK